MPLTADQIILLKEQLSAEFVPHLPPLLNQTAPPEYQARKNVSRAFSAFALQKVAQLDVVTAANAVVDDYEDNGLDAVHYHQASKTLFLVQSKLKANEPFGQADAHAFINGIRDLLNQHYDRFNRTLQDRQRELESALDDAAEIVLLISRASPIFSEHADRTLRAFLADKATLDERLRDAWIDFGPEPVLEELLAAQAVATVNDDLVLFGAQKIDLPCVTYYGQVEVSALVNLYLRHGNALLEKNIRYFLGIGSSDVNRAISDTLERQPDRFFYLSNGVTAIAHAIAPKAVQPSGGKRFEIGGLSIVNGAQTIASSHHFTSTHPDADVSAARVLLTLIQVNRDDPFGASVTRARNHQNPVATAHFAALDDIQERLRRELAFDNIIYRYRPEARSSTAGLAIMTIDKTSAALALMHADPGFPVTLAREPSKFLDSQSAEYGLLFSATLSGRRLANAVRLFRHASNVLTDNERSAAGLDRLIYRHGRYVIMWLTFGANPGWLERQEVMTDQEAATLLSQPLDLWRERVRASATTVLAATGKGPLAFFRNLTDTRPFVVRLRDTGV